MSNAESSVSRTMQYHLRFQVVPGFEETIPSLVDFCVKHQVSEVALFIGAEEWCNGLLTPEGEMLWCATVLRAKIALEEKGIIVSLNPWMTVLHNDRGRKMPECLPFARMVSPSGIMSKACASFGDRNVVEYVSKLYGRFALMGFRLLWIEDDFRFRHRLPLDWGGGFEDCILQRFSEEVGEPVTREAVLQALLQDGTPHPWRKRWIELWGQLHREMMTAIAREVELHGKGKVSLGLMSSAPQYHSIEGRDWQKLFSAMEIGGKAAHRPNFASYSEVFSRSFGIPIQMLDLQMRFRKPEYEVAPEIESFPFSRWSKSHRQSWVDFTLCAYYGSDALLLDLFSFCGNSVDADPEVGWLLDDARPALDWITPRFAKQDVREGVGIYWREDAAQLFEVASQTKDLTALTPSPIPIGEGLIRYGVPITYSGKACSHFISGEMAWLVTGSELRRLLADGLLLDGIAASILFQRGFGSEIGVDAIELWDRQAINYSMERNLRPIEGFPAGYLLSFNTLPIVARITPVEGSEIWSEMLASDGSPMGCPGAISYVNEWGGRVVISAAGTLHRANATYQRQQQMYAWLDFLQAGQRAPFRVRGCPFLFPIQARNENTVRYVVLNGCADDAVPILEGVREGTEVTVTLLVPMKTPVTKRIRAKETVVSPFEIPSMGYVVFEMAE